MAQPSINNKLFLPCTHIEALSALKNSVKMVVVIHAFVFAQCFTGSVFMSLKQCGLKDFPIVSGPCLSLPSLFHTLLDSLAFFIPQQVWPSNVSMLAGRQLYFTTYVSQRSTILFPEQNIDPYPPPYEPIPQCPAIPSLCCNIRLHMTILSTYNFKAISSLQCDQNFCTHFSSLPCALHVQTSHPP